jgi:hypothetical protein
MRGLPAAAYRFWKSLGLSPTISRNVELKDPRLE